MEREREKWKEKWNKQIVLFQKNQFFHNFEWCLNVNYSIIDFCGPR